MDQLITGTAGGSPAEHAGAFANARTRAISLSLSLSLSLSQSLLVPPHLPTQFVSLQHHLFQSCSGWDHRKHVLLGRNHDVHYDHTFGGQSLFEHGC
jgi:hypothetical protein